jgi:hypothetical protein
MEGNSLLLYIRKLILNEENVRPYAVLCLGKVEQRPLSKLKTYIQISEFQILKCSR